MLRHLSTAREPRISWAVLEIVNGRVHWIWKLKNKPPQVMTSNKVISDNEWHSILIDVKGNVREITLLKSEFLFNFFYIIKSKTRTSIEKKSPLQLGT